MWYNCYTNIMRFKFDPQKSQKLKRERGYDLSEVQEVFESPYYLDQRSDEPEQYRAIGWVRGVFVSLIFEIRNDEEGEYYHLVTLWKSTKEEQRLYEKNS